MNLNCLLLADKIGSLDTTKPLAKVLSQHASECTMVGEFVIGPCPGKGKGLYSLKDIQVGQVVAHYGEDLDAYFEPNSFQTIPLFGDTAQKIAESLGVELSVYGMNIPATNPNKCFGEILRSNRRMLHGTGTPAPNINEFEKNLCSGKFIHYLNALVFWNRGWIGKPVKPAFLQQPFFETIDIVDVAKKAFGYDLVPFTRGEDRKLVSPGMLPAAYINIANNRSDSNCEFVCTRNGLPGLVATKKIQKGDSVEAKTYGSSYKKMNERVSINETLKSLEKWLNNQKRSYRDEGYVLAVKTLELFSKVFDLNPDKHEKVKSFLVGLLPRFPRTCKRLLKNAGVIEHAEEEENEETLVPGTLILLRNANEWWMGVVKGTNPNKSTRIMLCRDDLCFDQTYYLKNVRTFNLKNNFTRDVAGEGGKLPHTDSVGENDYAVLKHCIDWETHDSPLKETVFQTVGFSEKKASSPFPNGMTVSRHNWTLP